MIRKELCPASELPQPGLIREFSVEGRLLCVANEEGHVYALDGLCPHQGAPLAEGTLENGKLICPWHAWAFDLQTGEEQSGCESVGTYRVEREEGAAMVVLP